MLRERGSLPQSELSKLSGISKSRLSEILSELEKTE
ncbi:MarR family transcriptional regulator, partial [Sulfolobus sp. D5]